MSINFLRQTFLTGLVAVLPVAVTVYLVWALVSGFDALFGAIFPAAFYFPGIGFVLTVVTIFLVGLLLRVLITRRIWSFGEFLVARMPVVSQVYDAIKQMIGYISGTSQPSGGRAVLVRIGDTDVRVLGLLTRDRLDIADTAEREGLVSVFMPFSYQMGGVTLLVPRDQVEPTRLKPQEALRFVLTAGVRADGGGA